MLHRQPPLTGDRRRPAFRQGRQHVPVDGGWFQRVQWPSLKLWNIAKISANVWVLSALAKYNCLIRPTCILADATNLARMTRPGRSARHHGSSSLTALSKRVYSSTINDSTTL